MGLVELEKKSTVTVNGISTDDQVAHLGTLGQDNLGSLNMAAQNYNYKPAPMPVVDQGMSRGHVKKEANIVSICVSTVITMIFIIGFTCLAALVALKLSRIDIQLFPKLDSYSLKEYNDCIKRCFVILSGMVLGTCVILLIVYNIVIKTRFINNYLSRIGTFIYSFFVVIFNCIIFLAVNLIYFRIIDGIYKLVVDLARKGIITEAVNVETINLFKFVVVIVIVIFMVVNCFNVVSIVKDKNKFVFEEQM